MNIIVILAVAAAITWFATKANCVGNVFGCLLWIIVAVAIAIVTGAM